MPGQHASYGPSSSERVTTCPASYGLTAGLPDQPNEYAMLGTVAHDVHERALKDGVLASTFIGEEHHLVEGEGEYWLEKTFTVDDDMCEAVQSSIDRINDIICDMQLDDEKPELHVEQKIDISHWTPIPDQFGTSDVYVIGRTVLHVFDYKHGEGKKVFAERNTQGALYALGVLYKVMRGKMLHRAPFREICIHIHQPRLDHFDTWTVPLLDFLAFGDWIRERFALTVSDNPPFGPSDAACLFCKVKTTCKARAEMVSKLLDGDFEDYTSFEDMTIVDNEPPAFEMIVKQDVKLFTNEQLSFLRKYTKFVERWARDIDDEVERRLLHHEEMPDWKLVEGRGGREWLDEAKGRAAMRGAGIPDKEHFKIELLSPAAAEDKIKGRGKRKKVAEMAVAVKRIPGAPTVASVKDPRPAIDLLADAFEDYSNEADDGL